MSIDPQWCAWAHVSCGPNSGLWYLGIAAGAVIFFGICAAFGARWPRRPGPF